MEPRILYSADAAPLALATEVGQVLVQTQAPPLTPAAPAEAVQPGASAGQPSLDPPSAAEVLADQAASEAHTDGPRELVVIDSRVEVQADLLNDLLRQQADGRKLDVVVLGASDDGINVLTQALAEQPARYDAIHLIAHGEPGRQQLGAAYLDLETLRIQADQVAHWSQSLTANADLLLYGCDVAADPTGTQLLDALAALTGADVTGSTDKTGASLRGGNWALEYQTGVIESANVVGVELQQRWDVLLNATVITPGTETIVNTTTSGQQATPDGVAARQVATNANGQTVVVWRDHASGGVIHARLFNAAGVATSPPIAVSTHTASQEEPSVAIDASGRFVVVWTEGDNQDGDGKGVFGRVFDPTGTPSTGVFTINQVTAEDSWSPVVAVNPLTTSNINFYVTFTRYFVNGNSNGVQARAFQWDGTPVNNEFDVNTTGTNNQQNSAIAYAGDGTALIAWQSLAQDGSGWGIYGQRLDAAGAPAGPEFRINTTTAGDQFNPDVSADSNNNFMVAWTHDAGGAQGLGIMAQRLSASGSKIGSEFVVTQQNAGDQSNVSVSMAENGDVMFAWQSRGQDMAGTWGIYARNFRSDGVARGNEILVNATVAGDQLAPTVSYAGQRAVAVWSGRSDLSAPPDNDGVFLQRLSAPSAALVLAAAGGTSEAGGTTLLSVALDGAPTADVVLTLDLSDVTEAGLSQSTLTFTPGNWSVAQSVTVTGRDDLTVDGDQPFTIALTGASADLNYNGLTTGSPVIVNTDNDARNQIVVTTNSDVVDGDVTSLATLEDSPGADGRVSLREALLAANATVNGTGGADLIRFDLSSAAGRTILLSSALPAISDRVELDATTDPAYGGSPVVGIEQQGIAAFDGLRLISGSSGSVIRGLQVGGFFGSGIVVDSAANLLEHNYIGTDATGTFARGNQADGIVLRGNSSNTVVRSNVIAGSVSGNGISLEGANDTVVRDNLIGVSAAGSVLGNAGSGVSLTSGANANLIESNTIGGNSGAGVRISASNSNVVRGNGIGTRPSGSVDLHNHGHGVRIENGASSNLIGGLGAGAGNRIEFNDGRAIVVANFSGNSLANAFLANVINGNGYGIDLDPSAVTYSPVPAANDNDPGDTDTGPNALQNSPVLRAVLVQSGNTTLYGTLDSAPDTWFRIELFSDASVETGGRWQAAQFLGFVDVMTDSNGQAQFSKTIAAVPVSGSHFSASATRSDATHVNFYETSELSAAVAVNSPPVWVSPALLTIVENQTLVTTLQASDVNTPVQVLNWSITGGADASRLTLNSVTGQLSLVQAPDFEAADDADSNGTYEVLVQVSDGYEATTGLIRVSVLNSNESPTLQTGTLDLVAGSRQTLGRTTLDAVDVDSAANELVYEVTRASSLGKLLLDNNERAIGSRFTQSDVDQGRVVFEAQSAASGTESIGLALTDGAGQPAILSNLRINVIGAAPTASTAPAAPAGAVHSSGSAGTSSAAAPAGNVNSAPATTPANTGAIVLPATAGSGPAPIALGSESSGTAVRTPTRAGTPLAIVSVVSGGEPSARDLLTSRSEARDRDIVELHKATPVAGSYADLSRRMGLIDLSRRDAVVPVTTINTVAETTSSSWLKSAARRAELREELDRVRQNLDQSLAFDRQLVASSATVSASVSIGYVIWLLRGGVLLSSLLAAMPAWVAFDPLPILSRANQRNDEDDESLQDILRNAPAGHSDSRAHSGQAADGDKRVETVPPGSNAELMRAGNQGAPSAAAV